MNAHPSRSAAYLKLPIILTHAAWLRLVYLDNPARVDEMGKRLASVVQNAWQALAQQPDATQLHISLYQKDTTGQVRTLVPLTLSIIERPQEPPYLHIALQDEEPDSTPNETTHPSLNVPLRRDAASLPSSSSVSQVTP